MRKEIRVNPNGGPILTNVRVQGLVVAGYYLQFFEANSNNVIASYSGHNESEDDDLRALPNSAEKNLGRVLMLDTSIANIDDTIEGRTYKISLEIYQDHELVDAAIEENQLENNVQYSLILVKLLGL
ncbi:MAG: hypothetical protein ACOYNO_14410 [Saprospiraceae bacterium]